MVHCRAIGCFAFIGAACAITPGSFTVAEVKPHYQCTNATGGQDRVRQYIAGLAAADTGLITLIQTEFVISQPKGYTVFGSACGKHLDPVVVLVNEEQFSIVSTVGATVAGNYSSMPWIADGHSSASDNATNSMCISDPMATYGPDGSYKVGSRPYAGAVLLHKPSGQEVCMITGTFAHCLYEWTDSFVADVDQACGDRQLLFVADTNSGCSVPSMWSDSHWSMNEILANHSKEDWGPCHDPGLYQAPTCCNDLPEFPYPRYWYDRTAICRGGRVEDFKVETAFICGDTHAEHLSTSATVHLAEPVEDSGHCLDHAMCANMSLSDNQYFYDDHILPVDGLCCPTSFGTRLPCCDSAESAAIVV